MYPCSFRYVEPKCAGISKNTAGSATSQGLDLKDCPAGSVDSLLALIGGQPAAGAEDDGALYGWPGGSGGYVDFVFRVAAQELFGVQVAPGPLPYKTLRNADFKEVVLTVNDEAVLRFATAYGFRNIQTLMRKVLYF